MEVTVTQMNANDEVTIRTLFSEYCFRVISPVECKGVLSGGRLSKEKEAIFVETIRPTSTAASLSNHLKPGDRAVFLVGMSEMMKLTTSVITEIILSEVPSTAADDC